MNDRAKAIASDALRRQDKALAIWNKAIPVTGTLAEAYLMKERGLPLSLDILAADAFRFHPGLYYDGTHVPGLVALMRDPVTSEPVGIQRTYLTANSKKIERRMLGSAGVVMLSPSEVVTCGLGLAEGLETGLAVMTITGWRPVWAAMSAGAIRAFPVLAGVETLTIFADADAAGHNAAIECGRRLSREGIEVRVLAPPQSGCDWDAWLLRRRVA